MAVNTPLDIEKAPVAPPRTKILASGAVYDLDKGRIIKQDNSKNPHAITKENSRDFRLKRQEKTAALLRARIMATHNSSMPELVKSSAGAFAESGAMLYEQIVLNSEAYPRDRMEAWQKLGQYAEVLGDPRGAGADATPLQQATEYTDALARLVSELRGALSSQQEVQIHEANSTVISANE